MVRFRFKKGLRVFDGLRRWTLEKINSAGLLVFESQDEQSERRALSPKDFHTAWLRGQWVIDADSLGPGANIVWGTTPMTLDSLPATQREIVSTRLKILTALKAHLNASGERMQCAPKIITEWVKQNAVHAGLERPPHWSTVWRWWKRFANTQCATKLADAPRTGRCANGAQYAIFQEIVDEVYLRDQKLPGKAVIEEIDRFYLALSRTQGSASFPKPSQATIYRWLAKLNHAVVLAAREGKVASARALREVTGTVKVHHILERYEIDHTPVDVLLVCEHTGMVLGRPWLTLIIDRRSRMIAGFYLSYHAPSASSVMYALRQAMLPKDDLLDAISGIRNPWPVRGCPLRVVADNGMELHSDDVENFCLEALIELMYAGVAHPEMKGGIERLFRTLGEDLFHQLPGTVFRSVEQRGNYPSESRAALTLETFTQVLVRWIVDVYHCTPHRGLQGRTPLSVWQAQESAIGIDLPAFPRQLDLMVGHTASRTIFHYGVDYDCVRYSSTQLLAMAGAVPGNPQVAIKVYDDDISYIDALDPLTKEYVRVPAIDLEYASGINRHVHKLVREEVRKRFNDAETRANLLAVKAEIRAVVLAAIRAKKTRTRKRSAAVRLSDSEAVLGARPAHALSLASVPAAADDEQPIELFDDDETTPRIQSGLGLV